MTRKEAKTLPSRTPQFVSRETCAAEFEISLSTWDKWVKDGVVPRPYLLGRELSVQRWNWEEVRDHILARGMSLNSESRTPGVNYEALNELRQRNGRGQTTDNRGG